MKKKILTPEIEEEIVKAVKRNPSNIKEALTSLSEKTGINYYTLSSRWYKVLRQKQKCFFLMSSEADKINVNRKNITIDTSQMRYELEMKMGIMKKVLQLLEKL